MIGTAYIKCIQSNQVKRRESSSIEAVTSEIRNRVILSQKKKTKQKNKKETKGESLKREKPKKMK